jgi:hypothetical protein
VLLSNPFNSEIPAMEIEAVIDSGASCICITRRIVKELQLQRSAPTRMVAVGSDHPAGRYSAIVQVPQLDFEKFMAVVAPDKVHSAPALLLGRTFLEHFDFTYNGPSATFTFHNPAGHAAPLVENIEE